MTPDADTVPDDIDALRAALAAAHLARREAEARASSAEAMITHLKLLIAKFKHDRFGASSERGRKLLDQMELQLEELQAAASEDAAAVEGDANEGAKVGGFTRRKPVRAPLPAHLPRERVVIPSPTACPCCGGTLSKLSEDVTETLEVVPRQWKVVQTVREKFSCRACETISQPPAPFHPIARGRAELAKTISQPPAPFHPIARGRAELAKFSCRACETISQPPAPFHPIARGRAELAKVPLAKPMESQRRAGRTCWR